MLRKEKINKYKTHIYLENKENILIINNNNELVVSNDINNEQKFLVETLIDGSFCTISTIINEKIGILYFCEDEKKIKVLYQDEDFFPDGKSKNKSLNILFFLEEIEEGNNIFICSNGRVEESIMIEKFNEKYNIGDKNEEVNKYLIGEILGNISKLVEKMKKYYLILDEHNNIKLTNKYIDTSFKKTKFLYDCAYNVDY